VAWLARNLGGNRQNVQRIVNDLEERGLVTFEPNPHHRRAQLVVLTPTGRQAFEAAMQIQGPWVSGLAEGIQTEDIRTMHRVIVALREKLGNQESGD
jgi:DNA-binding MarR family transcriptional regulator